MFEAADPEVFAWYVKNYGPDVNLFVDHCQIVQLECLRAGIWGTDDTWGRILTYHDRSSHKDLSGMTAALSGDLVAGVGSRRGIAVAALQRAPAVIDCAQSRVDFLLHREEP